MFSRKGSSATNTASVQTAIKHLSKFIKTLDTVPQQELDRSASIIYENAVAQAPYRTGKLERAIYVKVSRSKDRPGLRAGASARSPQGYDYAGIQHENEDFNHPIKGKDHYISDPFNEEVKDLEKRLRKKVRLKK